MTRRRRSNDYYPPQRPRRRSRRTSRKKNLLYTRAPRKGTLLIAVALYILGIFGAFDLLRISQTLTIVALAAAGGLLILGALLCDL
jgi:pilus assembly protein TadC